MFDSAACWVTTLLVWFSNPLCTWSKYHQIAPLWEVEVGFQSYGTGCRRGMRSWLLAAEQFSLDCN